MGQTGLLAIAHNIASQTKWHCGQSSIVDVASRQLGCYRPYCSQVQSLSLQIYNATSVTHSFHMLSLSKILALTLQERSFTM